MENIFPERLTKCIQESNLSYEQIIEKVGWKSKSTLSKYANGKVKNPDLSKIVVLAHVFGVAPAWLAGFSEEKYSQK